MTRKRTSIFQTAIVMAVLGVVSCSSNDSGAPSGSISGEISDQEPSSEAASGPGEEESQAESGQEGAEAGGYEPEADPAPLPVDPAVRIGRLDNGLTYYLRHNDQPGKSLSLRLVVNAGSINEPEPGRGTAHFLEHMLFKGTDAYPGNSLDSTLRSLGVEFGPDLNAYASYDETVYLLTVKADPPENVPIAFYALSQMAHAATLDTGAVVAERGVVLDELRTTRETSYGYVSSEFDRIYLQGTPYEGRDPLGTAGAIESMTAGDLRTFYETWYVPSNMAVVAVGDWPVDELEALVVEHFDSIPDRDAPQFAVTEVIPDPDPSFYVVSDEGQGFNYISLDIPILPADSGTVGGQRLLVMESLIEVMLLNRLDEAYHRGELTQVDRPDLITFTLNRALRYYGTNWQGEDLDTASTGYISVLLTAQEYGFTQTDVDRGVEQYAVALQHQLNSAVVTEDSEFVQRYTAHYLNGADISTPRERHGRIMALLAELTAEELTSHFRWLMERAGPIVIAVGPDPAGVPETADLEAAIAAAAPRSEPPPIEGDVDELIAVPSPLAPLASRQLTVLEGFEWEFANGARVMFVYSDIDEGTVELRARSLGGWSRLEPGARALSRPAVEAVLASGVGDLTKLQVNRFLEESTASIGAFIGETAEGFDGSSGSNDIETLFQLLHLFVTDPRVDQAAFDQAIHETEVRISLAEVNPSWQALVAYNEARFDEAWHRPVATPEQLDSLTAESLLSLYERRLGDVDDLVVAVVGDVDSAVIERLASHYIGTLPEGADDSYADRRPARPAGVVQRKVVLDEDMSAVLEIYHEAEGRPTPLVSVTADVLGTVLDNRLLLLIREQLGTSYNTSVALRSVLTPRPAVLSEVLVTADPDRLEEIHSTVLSILDDMVANGPTTEEIQQALAVVEADYENVSNGTLLGVLTRRLYLHDDDLLTPQRSLEELDNVGADAVQALAADLYGAQDRIEIVSAPQL